jgi:bacillithiol biosynthesis cysteine-adding enzyme BshC
MSGLPRLARAAFGAPGSLGSRFAAGDPAAVDLFPGAPGEGSGSGDGAGASVLPPSCESPTLTASAFGASSPDSAAKLRAILAGEGAFVTTGQQPCLFLGPMFVLYKAMTAIRLAAALERELACPVLALFWVASDDHDWKEVGTTHLIDTSNSLRSFRLNPPDGQEQRSVGRTMLDGSIHDLLAEVREALPKSEFIDRYMELFGDAYRPDRSVGRAFGEALTGVLGGGELVWLDSAELEVKQALVPLHVRALRHAASAAAAVTSSTERVREAGFEPQLALPGGASNVFHDDGVARRRIYVEGDVARAGKEGGERPLDELLAEVERSPEAFGPSAALRPVAESCLLPVSASVLGPAEVAYWAQLPGLFEWAGIGMPRTVPRTGWTVIEAKVARVLDALELSPDELSDGGAAVVERSVRGGRPEAVARALVEEEAAREGAFDRILEALSEEMPGIRATAEKARAGARKAARQLEKAVDASVLERESVMRRKIEKTALHLYPAGDPQERILNPLYYLARYGPEFLESLDQEVGKAVEEYVARLDGAL